MIIVCNQCGKENKVASYMVYEFASGDIHGFCSYRCLGEWFELGRVDGEKRAGEEGDLGQKSHADTSPEPASPENNE